MSDDAEETPEPPRPLPWGLDESAISRGSVEELDQHKLKLFERGAKPTANPFLQHKQEQEAKKKRAEAEAAQAYAEFIKDFESTAAKSKAIGFVRGDVIVNNKVVEQAPKEKAIWKPEAELERKMGAGRRPRTTSASEATSDQSSSSADMRRGKEKKISNLERFKEQLKMHQARREARGEGRAAMPEHGMASEKGSFDTGDPTTTNLYVGNLSPAVTEDTLCRTFGRYGPLASVKIMWPHTEEERARGRNCGFVAFMERADSEKALDALRGTDLEGVPMRMGWSKAVALPPQPIYVANPGSGPVVVSGLPFNAQPKIRKRAEIAPPGVGQAMGAAAGLAADSAVEEAVVYVIIPKDREIRRLIHRIVQFVLLHGPAFERKLIERKGSDPKFKRILLDYTHPEHVYYRWKLFSLLQGDAVDTWRTEPFRMHVGGPTWMPPDKQDDPQNAIRGQLSSRARSRLDEMLRTLTVERRVIGEAMVFCINKAEASEEVVDCITSFLCDSETAIMAKVAVMFLISDILHNSAAPIPNASSYRNWFERKLVAIFESLNESYRAITRRLRAEQFRRHVMACLNVWRDWCVFTPDYFDRLDRTFNRKKAAAAKGDAGGGSADAPAAPPAPADAPTAALASAEACAPGAPPLRGAWSGAAWKEGGNEDGDDGDDDDVDGVPLAQTKPMNAAQAAAARAFADDEDDDDDDVDGVPLNAAGRKRPAIGFGLSNATRPRLR